MEIKASELRVNNSVISHKHNGLITEIHTIMPNGVRLWANPFAPCYNFDEISGIPLTEELLLKLGFECTNFHFYTRSDMGGIYLRSPFSNANRYYVKTNEGSKLGLVRHVHELQNWYYILSGGQELTLS